MPRCTTTSGSPRYFPGTTPYWYQGLRKIALNPPPPAAPNGMLSFQTVSDL